MNTQLVDTEGAAAHLSLSESYLEKLRVRGGGPTHARMGRAVRYRICDLDAWVASCLVGSA